MSKEKIRNYLLFFIFFSIFIGELHLKKFKTKKEWDMEKLEYKILYLLNQGYAIDYITKNLNIKDENLADIIIDLNEKDLIIIKDKKWMVTDKGRDIFEKRDELLKKLKVEYMYGEISNREEYNRRKSELEDISQIISVTNDIIEKESNKPQEDIKIIPKICPKCGTENKKESNYCRSCGTELK